MSGSLFEFKRIKMVFCFHYGHWLIRKTPPRCFACQFKRWGEVGRRKGFRHKVRNIFQKRKIWLEIVSAKFGWKRNITYICNMSWADDDKPFLRQETCWRYKSGRGNGTKCSTPGRITHVFCAKRRRWVNNNKACVCELWDSLMPAELYYREDGIPVRNKTSLDYRTENQWNMVGRCIKTAPRVLKCTQQWSALRRPHIIWLRIQSKSRLCPNQKLNCTTKS